MRLKTANARKRRNYWKRRGHVHVKFNQGIWLRAEIVDSTGEWPEAQQVVGGSYQPQAYVYYP